MHKKYTISSGHQVVDVENTDPAQPVLDMKGLDICAVLTTMSCAAAAFVAGQAIDTVNKYRKLQKKHDTLV